MTSAELEIEVQNRIANNAALQAFCQEYFGREAVVYLGMDEDRQPEAAEYPVIVLDVRGYERGNKSPHRVWTIVVGAGVVDETVERTARTVTYRGALLANRLRELAEETLMAPGLGNVETGLEMENETFFPMHTSVSLNKVTRLAKG